MKLTHFFSSSSVSSLIPLPKPCSAHSFSLPLLSIAGTILLMIGNSLANSFKFHEKLLEGGVKVNLPNINSISRVIAKYGPFLSPEFNCSLHPRFPENTSLYQRISEYENKVMQEPPEQIKPYLIPALEVSPVRNYNLARFPKNMDTFYFTGLAFFGNGNIACNIENDLNDYLHCVGENELRRSIKKEDRSKAYSEKGFRTKGTTFSFHKQTFKFENLISNIDIKFNVGINPKHLQNHRLAVEEVEKTFLQNDCFFKQSAEEMEKFIQSVHEILLKDIPETIQETVGSALSNKLIPGQYRNENTWIINEGIFYNEAGERELSIDYLRKQGFSEKELLLLYRSDGKDIAEANFSHEELAVWKKIAYFFPKWQQVPSLMSLFAIQFKKYAEQDLHPVALAAWVHTQLVMKIHPFHDGNGRVARLLVNAILVRGGFEPVIFNNESEYQKAVNENSKKPGAFADYLVGLIKKQSADIQLLAHVEEGS